MLVSVQPEAMWNSDSMQVIRQTFPEIEGVLEEFRRETELSLEDMERISIFLPGDWKFQENQIPVLALISTKKPLDKETILALPLDEKGTQEVAKKTIHKRKTPAGDLGICFLTDEELLLGSPEQVSQFLQERPKPTTSGRLSEPLERARSHQFLAYVSSDLVQQILAQKPKFPDGEGEEFNILEGLDTATFTWDLTNQFKSESHVTFKDPQKAKEAAALFDFFMRFPLQDVNLLTMKLEQAQEKRQKFLIPKMVAVLAEPAPFTGPLVPVIQRKATRFPPYLTSILKKQAQQQKEATEYLALAEDLISQVKIQTVKKEVRVTTEIDQKTIEKIMEGTRKQAESNLAYTTAKNNMMRIGLAFHNYHDQYNTLPPPELNRGLSWRVAILPAMGRIDLYNQFNLGEPWDSDHNKALLSQMPKAFELPGVQAKPGHTYFRVFVGPKTAFPPNEKLNLSQFNDGTANTILFVEAYESVPWTKPDELQFSPDEPLPWLGGHFAEGILAVTCDGAVQTLPYFLPDETFRSFITPDGGEPTDLGRNNGIEFNPF